MNDFRDLKAIAEACQQHQPLRFMPSHGALYIRNDNGIVFDVHQNRSFPEFMAQNKDYADLVLAANPAKVLALIAENERMKTLRSKTERDLAQELEVWRHGPSCWNCGDTGDVHDMVGEWLGQCDCNAAKLIDVASERDQLRAENAGLKTGYEAYERVNAELKAEVEESASVIDQLAKILAGVAVAIKGEELPLHRHGYHDLVEGVTVLKLENDLRIAENEELRREREGKVLCELELFETLRDSAGTEADEHRQCMATYRPLRQASLDSVVKKCDDLLAAMGKGEQS